MAQVPESGIPARNRSNNEAANQESNKIDNINNNNNVIEAAFSPESSSEDEDEVSNGNEDQHPDLSHVDSLEKLVGGSQGESDRESDEGLGDISSEASSPQPTREETTGQNNNENAKLDAEGNQATKSSTLLASPADERMPSRISLSVQTSL